MNISTEQALEMLKALSNDTRLEIMHWLANPEESFSDLDVHVHHIHGIPGWGGVCVGTVQERSGLSQSTISTYLTSMQKAGLLESRRHEKWTYYRINKAAVRELCAFIDEWR